MKTGVFAGSFCPVTKGHVDAIEKVARLVDKLFVVVGYNEAKQYEIPTPARTQMVKRAVGHIANVEVVSHSGMMTDFCKEVKATVMVKSIRNALDLQSVIDLSDTNSDYWNGDTVFVVGSRNYRNISSSLVRELAHLGQDFSAYVPENCLDEIKKYLCKENCQKTPQKCGVFS